MTRFGVNYDAGRSGDVRTDSSINARVPQSLCPKLITGSPFPRSLVCCDFFREFTLYRRPTGYRMYRNFLHSRVIYGINGALPLRNIVLRRMLLFFSLLFYLFLSFDGRVWKWFISSSFFFLLSLIMKLYEIWSNTRRILFIIATNK